MVKERTEQANTEETEKRAEAFKSLIDNIQGGSDIIKEKLKFPVWGKSGLYAVEEAAKMRKSKRALAKLSNPKLRENAMNIAKEAEAVNKKFAGVGVVTSALGIFFDGKEIYDAWNKAEKSQTDKILTTVIS